MIRKLTEPQEFVGQHTTDARQVGDYLHIRHTYTSDELERLGIDHVFREEIHPVPPTASDEEISQFVNTPTTSQNYTMSLVHEDDVSTFDKIRINGTEVSAQSFRQWNVVKAEKNNNTQTSNVDYRQASYEDWASKEIDTRYQSYDPINLIWSDAFPEGSRLILKVSDKMHSTGWNEPCPISSDLYVNIGGTWKKQDKHYVDNFGSICHQYHVRAWQINADSVIGSAHKEHDGYKLPRERIDILHISSSGPNVLERNAVGYGIVYHSLSGFDTAEDEAAGEFTGSCWSVAKDSVYLGNQYTRKTFKNNILENTARNDGYATVIRCS